MKQRQTKNNQSLLITSSLVVIVFSLLIGIPGVDLIKNAFAGHPNCSSADGQHCYARMSRNAQNSGNQASIVAKDLSISCNTTNKNFALTTQWLRLSSTEWLEGGYLTGWGGTQCYNDGDHFYAYKKINGVGTWLIEGLVTHGTTYNWEVTDKDANTIWKLYRNGVQKMTASTFDGDGWGDVGAEVTDNGATVPKTKINNIKYYSGGWTSWLSNVNTPASHAPLDRNICFYWYDANFGTGGALTCP